MRAVIIVVLWSLFAAAASASESENEETLVWRGAPIRVDLKLGQERIVHLPGAGRLRAGLIGGPVPGLRIQVLGDHAYLLAEQPFASTRLILRPERGSPVLLDLAADKRFKAGPTLAVLTSAPGDDAVGVPDREAAAQRPLPPAEQVGYVALVRHAAQSLYAPPRLAPRSSAIVRAPLRVHAAVPLIRGGPVEAVPVAAWRAEGANGPLWLTAVRLTNLSHDPVVLDPRDLRGRWRAASFQHARLFPFGDDNQADTTTAYLISGQPFEKAMAPWLDAPAPLTLAAPAHEPEGDRK